jgi:tetratricopeptide (TPR) repeat protein
VGGVDHERVDMLKRALARLGDTDSPDRARLLALLCVEATWDAGFDERLSLATEAVDIARRTGDNAALVDAIRLCHESITMPQTLELRVRWNNEACDLADDLGDSTARLHANDYRSLAALEAGDLATMRTSCAIFESESERIGQPLNHWQIAYHCALQRMLGGDLDAAEQSANEALTLGTAAGYPDDAVSIYRGQVMVVRWMQGRLHARRSLPSSRPRTTTPEFQLLRATRLLPWHDQFATTHVSVQGCVAHYLGLLACVLDRHDEAEHWFSEALAFHEAMEAPFFVALTQTAWADFLADRDRPGDALRAQDLAGAALPVASERGYGYVERDARSVLERIR